MLKKLHIENIAVIENETVEFFDGLNVLTGETGAGKSVILNSINLILGNKVSTSIIRTNCEFACARASFSDLSQNALEYLKDFEFDGDCLEIERKITLDNKSQNTINGKKASLKQLKELGVFLLEKAVQHEAYGLINKDSHIEYLDDYISLNKTKEFCEYSSNYNRLKQVQSEFHKVKQALEDKDSKKDYLSYQIKEIESLNLVEGEKESLTKQIKDNDKIKNEIKKLSETLSLLDSEDGAINKIESAINTIESLNLDEFNQSLEKAKESLSYLEELNSLVKDRFSKISEEDAPLEQIEERLSKINECLYKYDDSEKVALDKLNSLKEELEQIEQNEIKAKKLKEEFNFLANECKLNAEKLSEIRQKMSKSFVSEVKNLLANLNMSNADFVVNFNRKKLDVDGFDDVEFLLKSNVGMEFNSLKVAASGGEISRVMLAIKKVLSAKTGASTIVFDEIDQGLSGDAANKVGKLIKNMSEDKQILLVTHIASVAAIAQNHYEIKKSDDKKSTKTAIKKIDGEDRIIEIARLLGSVPATKEAKEHAKKLIMDNDDQLSFL